MAGIAEIRAYGLDRISKAEFTEFLRENYPELPHDAVRFETAQRSEKYGEPATIVLILSYMAVRAFVAWLALRPRNKHVSQRFDIQLPDGTVISASLDVKVPESGEVEPELVKELLSLKGLTPDALEALTHALGK
jgi:hypothetical protein